MSQVIASRANDVEDYNEWELMAIAAEIGEKLKVCLKIVDTFTKLMQQDGNINALQTFWGPMFHYAIGTPRAGGTIGTSDVFGELIKTEAKPRLYSVCCIVPPGGRPKHFEQLATLLPRVCRILGAPAHIGEPSVQEWKPGDLSMVTIPMNLKTKLVTGSPTFALVTYTWDTGSDGEVAAEDSGEPPVVIR